MSIAAPEVSVLLPVFNGERYISEAVQSILDQTYSNFELLIIDDCSTDRTPEIVLSFRDKRIQFLRSETNSGLIANLNTLLKMARGRYVARMDADDISLPERLSLQVRFLESNPEVLITGSDYFLFDGKNKRQVSTKTDSDYLRAMLMFSTCFAHPTVMFRNPAGKFHYERDFIHAEDYRLWTKMAIAGPLGSISAPLLLYRQHEGQISVSNRGTQREMSDRIRKDYIDQLGFVYTDRQLQLQNIIGNNVFIESYPVIGEIEAWLRDLREQNKRIRAFGQPEFDALLAKFWYDSCGYTGTGFRALRSYLRSPLSDGKRQPGEIAKLMAKLVVRMITKR